MRKEVLLAIIFGIILGGIILYGINLANRSVANLPANTQTVTPSPTTTPSKLEKVFSVTYPTNHLVTTDKTINITGQAKPNTTIAIVSESDDLIIQASPEGTFSAEINLIGGENTITVTALKPDQTTDTEAFTIIQTNTLPE